ncbi:MAG: hypothetical protein J6U21_10940, partial [Bacteroidales bacterium]|nr:hypothetical protein [Bacteroidales bacterium]
MYIIQRVLELIIAKVKQKDEGKKFFLHKIPIANQMWVKKMRFSWLSGKKYLYLQRNQYRKYYDNRQNQRAK